MGWLNGLLIVGQPYILQDHGMGKNTSLLRVPKSNKGYKVRVHAEMFKDGYWDVKVVDNTNGGAIYVMDGGYHNSHRGVSVRNLHAKSGWTGYGYGKPRVSAPFAILDSIYQAMERVREADSSVSFLYNSKL